MGRSTGNRCPKKRVWENERNKEKRDGEKTYDAGFDSLEGRHALLFRRTFPFFSLPLPFPFTSDFPKTLRGRRPAEQSQSHHLDLSKHSGEGGWKAGGKERKREGDKWETGLTACTTQGESLPECAVRVCVARVCDWRLGWGSCGEAWNWEKQKAVWKGKSKISV